MAGQEENSAAPIYLLDGGLGTTLADNYSVTFDASKPLWSSQLLISSPATLLAAQTAFVDSGADVLLTVTYQASYEGFARCGVPEAQAEVYMRSAVSIARDAFNSRAARVQRGKVALSLGAYGATMIPGQEYSGRYDDGHVSAEQLREWHLRRLGVFFTSSRELEEKEKQDCWSNVDLVAFETLPLLQEVEAVRLAMGNIAASSSSPEQQKPFWICCVFPGEESVLPDGSSVKEVVKSMIGRREGAAKPMGIGFNCTKISKAEELVRAFEDAVKEFIGSGEAGEAGEETEWPALVLYPDGTNGEVYNTTTQVWEQKGDQSELPWDETLHDIVSRARSRNLWKSIYVGGCCKTTPVEIRKLGERIAVDRVA